ncbi:ATP synthase subunit I [Paenibacillus silviterrae]|uniref:ATP synthase subunit I n=1 Tax=Paenibacillus silviterrae TaxID=3242194 RepID=UPI002542E86C|nr:ATP synthase subunit I [Paenibacillus chinjuensis]
MDEFAAHLKTVQRFVCLFLSVCFFAWALLPAYRPIIAGLILGTVFSFVNAMYLAWKIRQLSESALQGKRKRGLGFGNRTAIAIIAMIIAYKLPEHFAMWSVIAGLISVQLATLLLGIISNKK